MFKFHLLKFLSWDSSLLHETPGGGGTGVGAGAGGGSGAGMGGGAAAPAPVKISGDTLVDFGDGKPVKWSEASHADTGRYVERSRYDAGVQYLNSEAQRLQLAWNKYHEGTGARPAKAEPAAQGRDPLEGIRDQPVIDGRTLAGLYQTLQSEGFAPIANVMKQMADRLKLLEGSVGAVGKTAGSLAAREGEQQFESFITQSFTDAGAIKGLPEGVNLDGADPALREMAKDLYLSHEPNSWKKGEFAKSLNARVSAAIALVRSLDKKAVEVAQGKRRTWMNPNKGQGHPNGNAPYKFQRGADVARNFFGAEPQNT